MVVLSGWCWFSFQSCRPPVISKVLYLSHLMKTMEVSESPSKSWCVGLVFRLGMCILCAMLWSHDDNWANTISYPSSNYWYQGQEGTSLFNRLIFNLCFSTLARPTCHVWSKDKFSASVFLPHFVPAALNSCQRRNGCASSPCFWWGATPSQTHYDQKYIHFGVKIKATFPRFICTVVLLFDRIIWKEEMWSVEFAYFFFLQKLATGWRGIHTSSLSAVYGAKVAAARRVTHLEMSAALLADANGSFILKS